MGRVSGTSKQLRGAREAGSVTSCLARIQDHPLGSREMLCWPRPEPQCRVPWPRSTFAIVVRARCLFARKREVSPQGSEAQPPTTSKNHVARVLTRREGREAENAAQRCSSKDFLFLGVAPRGTMHAAPRDHHRQGRTRARKGRRVKFEVIVNLFSKKLPRELRPPSFF